MLRDHVGPRGAETRHVAAARGAGKAGLPYRSSGSETGTLCIPRSTGLDQGRAGVVRGQLCRGSPSELTPNWLWAFWQAVTFSLSFDPFLQTLRGPEHSCCLPDSLLQPGAVASPNRTAPTSGGHCLEGSSAPTFPPHGFQIQLGCSQQFHGQKHTFIVQTDIGTSRDCRYQEGTPHCPQTPHSTMVKGSWADTMASICRPGAMRGQC